MSGACAGLNIGKSCGSTLTGIGTTHSPFACFTASKGSNHYILMTIALCIILSFQIPISTITAPARQYQQVGHFSHALIHLWFICLFISPCFFCEYTELNVKVNNVYACRTPAICSSLSFTFWLVDWGLTSLQQLRSYGDGTSVYSPIRRTGEARDRTCDPWFTRRVTSPLHHGGFFIYFLTEHQ